MDRPAKDRELILAIAKAFVDLTYNELSCTEKKVVDLLLDNGILDTWSGQIALASDLRPS